MLAQRRRCPRGLIVRSTPVWSRHRSGGRLGVQGLSHRVGEGYFDEELRGMGGEREIEMPSLAGSTIMRSQQQVGVAERRERRRRGSGARSPAPPPTPPPQSSRGLAHRMPPNNASPTALRGAPTGDPEALAPATTLTPHPAALPPSEALWPPPPGAIANPPAPPDEHVAAQPPPPPPLPGGLIAPPHTPRTARGRPPLPPAMPPAVAGSLAAAAHPPPVARGQPPKAVLQWAREQILTMETPHATSPPAPGYSAALPRPTARAAGSLSDRTERNVLERMQLKLLAAHRRTATLLAAAASGGVPPRPPPAPSSAARRTPTSARRSAPHGDGAAPPTHDFSLGDDLYAAHVYAAPNSLRGRGGRPEESPRRLLSNRWNSAVMHRTHDVRLAVSGTEAAADGDAPTAPMLALPPLSLSARGAATADRSGDGGRCGTTPEAYDAAFHAQLLADAVMPYERPPRWQTAPVRGSASPR